jgi:hypothetical protein
MGVSLEWERPEVGVLSGPLVNRTGFPGGS